MSLITFGGAMPNAPFNRTFFNVTLGGLLEGEPSDREAKLTLFLTDGSTLEVCQIDELTDTYLAVRAYKGGDQSCSLTVALLPYSLIYRIEIAPKDASEQNRLGFHWQPVSAKAKAKSPTSKRRGKRS